MKDYSWAQYRRDAGTGFRAAVAFCAYTALILGLFGLVNLLEMVGRMPLQTPWTTYGAVVAVVWSSYLIAGQLGAGAYFLFRPLRKWTVGWMLTGAAIATAAYGTMGYMLAIFYEPVGRAFLEHSTRAEVWHLAHSIPPMFAGIGALFGGYHASRARERVPRDEAAERPSPAPGGTVVQPRLLTVEPYDSRMFCECCGYPTLLVPLGQYELEFDSARSACLLCEWESPRLTEAGVPIPDGPNAEERNDGHSLAEARANFARHLSMYDPAKLEPWMLGPPSAGVIQCKRALRDAYDALLAAPDSSRGDSWTTVRACEDALAAQLAADRDPGAGSDEPAA